MFPQPSFISQMEQRSGVSFHEAQVALAREWMGDMSDGVWHQQTVAIKMPSPSETGGGLTQAEVGGGGPRARLAQRNANTAGELQEVPFPPSEDIAHEIVKRFEHGADGLRGDEAVSDSVAQHVLGDTTRLEDEQWLGTQEEERFACVCHLVCFMGLS